jgi:hypothetical protein
MRVLRRHNLSEDRRVFSSMNTDQKLRRLLTDAADSYDPPALGGSHSWREGFWQRRVVQTVAAVVALCLVIAGIGLAVSIHRDGSGSSASSTGASSGGEIASVPKSAGGAATSGANAPAAAASSGAQSAAGRAAAGGTSATAGSSVPTAASRVVQTGQFSLEVAKGQVRPVLARLTALAAGSGGYISASSDDDTQALPTGTSTLRVPVASFDSVTAQVRKLGQITSASTTARDVTSQYVDLGARISAAQQTRDAYYTLLTKATTIGDTLAVQQTLQAAQTTLEQLQGQQKVLADSSDLATLTVNVAQKSATGTTPIVKKSSDNGFGNSLRSGGHMFNTGLQAVITALGPILLVVIVLGIIGGLVLLGRRVYRTLSR